MRARACSRVVIGNSDRVMAWVPMGRVLFMAYGSSSGPPKSLVPSPVENDKAPVRQGC